jgi:hypothetical protein
LNRWFGGIQSWWNEDRRTAFVCGTSTIGQQVVKAMIEIEKSEDQFIKTKSGILVPKSAQ